MIYIVLNLTPILAATLAGLAVGGLYHAAVGRGGARARGLSPSLVVVAALAEFWLCAILAGAVILAPSKAGAWTMALGSAVIIWIGFVAPAVLVTLRYRGLPWRTASLDCLHWLAVMATQAAVLRLIGVSAPPG